MAGDHEQLQFPFMEEVGLLVETVRTLGERARFLAVNLAVAAAKLKQEGASSTRLNEEILDLVARITRASQDVNDALKAMEAGSDSTDKSSPRLWSDWRETGIPDQQTLDKLESSLQETLELSKYIFRWMKDVQPADLSRAQKRRRTPRESLSDGSAGEDAI